MNFARVAASAVAAWVVSLPVGFFVNEIVLADLLAANAAAMRPREALMANLPFGFAAALLGFFVFAYMYAKGYEGTNGTVEGIRFGVLTALFVSCFGLLWNWVVFPISGMMALATIVDRVAEMALYGAIVGTIYKPAARSARRPVTVA